MDKEDNYESSKTGDFLIGFILPIIILMLLIKLKIGVLSFLVFTIFIIGFIGLAIGFKRKHIAIGLISFVVAVIIFMGYGVMTCKGPL